MTLELGMLVLLVMLIVASYLYVAGLERLP